MAESAEADPLIGRLIAQKFKVERLLGAGAMGRVYLAEQINLGKPIALKVLHSGMAGDAQLAKRFYREAKSASMLSHPNILQIIDFGDDEGLLFIAMELLTGRDLYRVIKSDFPFALERVAHIGGQILGALDEAHAKGVVHRDLKPENVMLLDVRGEPDFVKVCDFGIAKVASERDGEGSAITMAGMVCGTPEYMSPEQARGEPLDGRSDLYAMAVILYQMVAGDVPFRAESALGVITKHLTEEPTPPSKRRNAALPAALEAVILRGLRKDKAERFGSAAEMKAALLEAAGLKRPSSSSQPRAPAAPADVMAATAPATPVSGTSQPAAPSSGSVHGELAAATPRRRGGLFLVGGVIVVAAGAALLAIGGRHAIQPAVVAQPQPTPTPPTATQPPATAPAATVTPTPTPPAPVAKAVAPPPPVAPTPAVAAPEPAPPRHKKEHHAAHAPAVAAPAPPTTTAPAPPPKAAPKSPGADADALLKSGDVEGALAKYLDAARQDPSDAALQRQIGKCYNRLGERDKALPYFKRYLELAPNAKDAAFYRSIVDGK